MFFSFSENPFFTVAIDIHSVSHGLGVSADAVIAPCG